MQLRNLAKKGLSFVLAATMALSTIFTTGVISTVPVQADSTDKNLPASWGVKAEDESYGIDAPIPRNVFSLIEDQGVEPVFSSTLPKLKSSDNAYKWVKNMEERAGEWDKLKSKGVYGGKLKTDTEYSVTYPNVTLDSGKKLM